MEIKSLNLDLQATKRTLDQKAAEGTKKMHQVAAARAQAAAAQERCTALEKKLRTLRRQVAAKEQDLLHWAWFYAKCNGKTQGWVNRLKRTPPRRLGYTVQ